MENNDLLKRAEELSARSESRSIVTSTGFLTPAEQMEIKNHVRAENLMFFGGNENSERKIAFFLPYYIDAEGFDAGEYICAIRAETKFGNPAHREYMGAILGLGIKRESVGDIYVSGETAYFYCLPPVASHILLSLDKIGRYGAKTEQVSLQDVPVPKREMKNMNFTVQSMRIDAVASSMFSMSRTAMVELIAAGNVTKNYSICLKSDAPVSPGDIISVRGRGKGEILEAGNLSRKGRIFVNAGIYK